MSKADNHTNQQASKTEYSPKRNNNKRILKIFLFSFFSILLAWTFREEFLREWEVEVTQAIVFPNTQKEASDAKTTAGTQGDLLLQATGWIEPDPFPIAVTSLYSGVVQNVHVLEGQKVKKGETIVSLIDEDAQLAYAEAKASLSQSQAKESEITLFNKHVGSTLWWDHLADKGPNCDVQGFLSSWDKQVEIFRDRIQKYYLY